MASWRYYFYFHIIYQKWTFWTEFSIKFNFRHSHMNFKRYSLTQTELPLQVEIYRSLYIFGKDFARKTIFGPKCLFSGEMDLVVDKCIMLTLWCSSSLLNWSHMTYNALCILSWPRSGVWRRETSEKSHFSHFRWSELFFRISGDWEFDFCLFCLIFVFEIIRSSLRTMRGTRDRAQSCLGTSGSTWGKRCFHLQFQIFRILHRRFIGLGEGYWSVEQLILIVCLKLSIELHWICTGIANITEIQNTWMCEKFLILSWKRCLPRYFLRYQGNLGPLSLVPRIVLGLLRRISKTEMRQNKQKSNFQSPEIRGEKNLLTESGYEGGFFDFFFSPHTWFEPQEYATGIIHHTSLGLATNQNPKEPILCYSWGISFIPPELAILTKNGFP